MGLQIVIFIKFETKMKLAIILCITLLAFEAVNVEAQYSNRRRRRRRPRILAIPLFPPIFPGIGGLGMGLPSIGGLGMGLTGFGMGLPGVGIGLPGVGMGGVPPIPAPVQQNQFQQAPVQQNQFQQAPTAQQQYMGKRSMELMNETSSFVTNCTIKIEEKMSKLECRGDIQELNCELKTNLNIENLENHLNFDRAQNTTMEQSLLFSYGNATESLEKFSFSLYHDKTSEIQGFRVKNLTCWDQFKTLFHNDTIKLSMELDF